MAKVTDRPGDAKRDDDAAPPPDEWPELVPLDGPPVPPFPTDALPGVLADMVRDGARVTGTPVDLAACLGLVTVAAAGARRVDVAIGTTHVEPLNLFAMVVAESGTRKGPAQRQMTAPLHAEQAARRQAT